MKFQGSICNIFWAALVSLKSLEPYYACNLFKVIPGLHRITIFFFFAPTRMTGPKIRII